ncbi:septation regulator SpoVG [Peptoniphilus porci]|nr:septation regulator SpoVG [Peptoniphilus porci]OLR64261.1 septation protein SpoVG [Peptoniphilus porci]
MNITDVRLRKLPTEGKLKAIVSVTFDNEFVLHDIKIIEGNESLFLAMPSRRLSNGEYRDIAHPINAEARKELEDVVFKEYYAVKEKLDSEEVEKQEEKIEEEKIEEEKIEEE